MHIHKGFLSDRITYSKKKKEWRAGKVDYLCDQVDTVADSKDWARMKRNYLMNNNIVDQAEYKEFCDPLNLTPNEGKDFVEVFNLTPNKISVLQGEEGKRPWNYSVTTINPEATNEILREKQREFDKYLRHDFKREIALIQQEIEQKVAAETEGLDPKEAEKQKQALMEKYSNEEAGVLNPNQLEKKYKSYKSVKELKMTHLLKALTITENIKHKKNQSFKNACIAGKEVVLVDIVNNETKLTILNPLGSAEHKSPEVEFYQNGDYFVYKQEMTISDVLEQLGDELDEEAIEKLEKDLSRISGLSTPLASKDGYSESHFEHLPNTEGTTNVEFSGSHGQSSTDDEYCTVYTTLWKSQRKVCFIKNPDGSMEMLGEEFEVPKHAKKTKIKEIVGRSGEKFTWTDEQGDYYELEWKWIPEVWKGRRINEDIYGHIKPMDFQLRSKINPLKVYLPAFGTSFNNTNAPIVSPMDSMYPWQKLYLMVMSKWLKLISKDKGVINLINMLMIDGELGMDKTMQYAQDTGMLPFNPLANAEGAGLINTMKAGEKLDLSNTQQLTYYTQILQFIEGMIGTAAGIPPEREGRTSSNTNVTDNQQNLMQSSHITEPFFAKHDLLWEDILNGLIRVEQFKFSNGKEHMARFILSDQEYALLKLEADELSTDEFIATIVNNARAHQDLQFLKQHANEILQNEKKGLSTLVTLMGTESTAEFKDYVLNIEKDIEEREAQTAKAQQEHEAKLMEREIEAREDVQAHQIDMIDREGEWDVKKAEISSFSFNEDQDSNANGIPDQLEIEKLRHATESSRKKAELDNKKIESDNFNKAEDRKLKAKEIKQKSNTKK